MDNADFPRRLNTPDDAEIVLGPAGSFIMGSDRSAVLDLWTETDWGPQWFHHQVGTDRWIGELLEHEVEIGSFWMYVEPVKIGQYYAFMEATGREAPVDVEIHGPWNSAWDDEVPVPGSEHLPVSSVSWEDA